MKKMTFEEFRSLLQEQIDGAELNKDSQNNVLDLRAFKAPYDGWENQGIYCTNEIEEAWEFIKDSEEWFIDIYENIQGANTAVFTDFALFFNL